MSEGQGRDVVGAAGGGGKSRPGESDSVVLAIDTCWSEQLTALGPEQF